MRTERSEINRIVLTGLMMALVLVATSLFKVPNPFTQGHLNLGDGMIFLSVMILGKKNGAIASGVGSALGDLLGGYAAWVPWTLAIKFAMAYVFGMVIERDTREGISPLKIAGIVAGGLVMCAGYYFAGYFLYGNWVTAIPAIPLNALQFAVGGVLAMAVSEALNRTPVGDMITVDRQ